jgi:hypothetical protein
LIVQRRYAWLTGFCFAILFAGGIAGCGGGSSSPPLAAPVIASFIANPSSIAAGQSSTLSWSVSGATSVAISGISGAVSSPQTVTPAATTSYTMTATGTGGTATATVSVTVTPAKPALVSIALSPLAVTLAPGTAQQLTVTGTYSDGTTQALVASGESFQSSNTSVATVSAAGLATAATGATAGATATISATDTASGDTTSAANSTVVIASTGPTTNSVAAATATAQNNSLCTAVRPFYWEIGDQNSALVSGSLGTTSSGSPVLATTKFSIASASKMIYGTYVVQLRGSAANLTNQDINFLHFTSGYTNMGSPTTGSQCPSTDTPDTVNTCLTLLNSVNGLPYSYQDPTTIGKFDYDGGHLENHASQFGGLGDVPVGTLGSTVGSSLGTNINITYTEPLLAGGIYASSNDYTQVLRNILKGSLFMRDALGTDPVCTLSSATGCNALHSPIPEAWHYSIAHWVEDDPATNGDGAFSSAGAFGFYPWIGASKKYYGVISREDQQGTGGAGFASAQCGRLIRRAWDTGVEQTGTIPTN